MSDAEEVGSISEEAWKLWCAFSSPERRASAAKPDAQPDVQTSGRDGSVGGSDEPHTCPTGWCPICQVAGFVRDHPEAVAQVGAAAASFLHSVRDLMSTPQPRGEKDPR